MRKFDRQRLAKALQLSSSKIPLNSFLTDIPDRPTERPIELGGQGKIGAVLLLVVSMQQEPKIVLTKRSSKMKNHAGQISFPGGRKEAAESLQAAALRETEEEIGVGREQIEIVGQLNSVYIPPSDFTIFPFVGCCDTMPVFQPSEHEVSEIIQAPVEQLMTTDSSRVGQVDSANGPVQAQFFDVGGHRVWGATGIVMNEFLQRIRLVQAT